MGKTSWLKADLHIHTCEDPSDYPSHSAREIVEKGAALGFDVLSITNHEGITFDAELEAFAAERGVLLLPGTEACIEKSHVLMVNIDPGIDPKSLRTFADLERHKGEENLIIAPHPFYPAIAGLGKNLLPNLHLFDAIEYSYFYTKRLNFNKKAVAFAEKHNLPLLGTSDCHYAGQFGITYSLIHGEKNPASIVGAVKEGKVKPVTRPLTMWEMIRFGFNITMISGKRKYLVKRKRPGKG